MKFKLNIFIGLIFTFTLIFISKTSQAQVNQNFTSLNSIDSRLSFNSADSMSQINSVQQLSDVSPTDWAYEALRGLVERYGCIVGYPDRTFRGNRALSRYEFAAGLNACLNSMERLIQESQTVFKEDLDILKRLAEEFETELAVLGSRVDNLESRIAFLEDHQFSTTTKLLGSAIFSVAGIAGNNQGDNQIVAQYRSNLNLVSSFTGKDLLLVSLFAGNAPVFGARRDGTQVNVKGTTFELPGVSVPVGNTPVNVEVSSAEGTLSSQFAANTANSVKMLALAYNFPLMDNWQVGILSSLAPFQLYAPTLNPYLDDKDNGTGAISVFGEYNPIYTLGGGGTGIVSNFNFTPNLKLTAGYLADGLSASNPDEGRGLFNGGYGALGQLTWNITDNFAVAGVYLNEYSKPGRFGFNYNALAVTGTAVANTLAGQDILLTSQIGFDASPSITNSYGGQFSWQLSPKFSISGWFSTFYTRLIGEGDGNILTYALTFAFPDFGKEGNLLGLVAGAEPYLTSFDGGNPQPFRVDVPLHFEAFYRHQINDHISVTPGIIWLTAPNQDARNDDDFIGTIRTTFHF